MPTAPHPPPAHPASAAPAAGARRCRARARPPAPGELRPTDLLAAFFVAGLAFLVAGGAAGVLDTAGLLGPHGHWLALHLAFLGGVSLLVLGAGQFFSAAFLATDPPPRALVRAQLTAWIAGTVLVAAGVPTATTAATDLGGLAIVAGLALFATALARLERRSLQRARWALRWYYACAASLGLGAVVGILMARGTAWALGSLLGAHLALNLAGWLGTAIVGTLHTFYPSLTHSPLAHPRLQPPTFAAWATGVAALAAGSAFDAGALLAVGWLALAASAALLAVNLVGCARRATEPMGLPSRLIGAGQGFLLAALALAVVTLVAGGPHAPLEGQARAALAVLLLAGWVGLTVAGALLHLLAVLLRVRHLAPAMPAPTPERDRALTALAAVAVAALAASRAPGLGGAAAPATIALLAAVALIGARIAALAARAVRSAGLRI